MAAKKPPKRDATLDDLIAGGYRYAPLADEPAATGTKASDTSAWRRVGDVGLSLMKGAIAVPEAAVGLADLASGGQVGKALENEGGLLGFRPKEAKAQLDEWLSPQQKAANQAVQEADGIVDTGIAALRNPSVIGHSVVESLPLMLGGGVVARALMKAAPVNVAVAGAAGEGVMAAGSSAESIRQETPGGLTTGTQNMLAGASGLATGLLGYLGIRAAQKLRIADIDTLIAGKAAPESSKGFIRQVLQGAFAEGVLEELPQSVQEQVAQNLALQRPLDEGVDKAAVLGALAGMAMGGGGQLLSRSAGDQIRQEKIPEAGPMTRAVNAPIELAAKAADAAPPIEASPPTRRQEAAPMAAALALMTPEARQAALEALAIADNMQAPGSVRRRAQNRLDVLMGPAAVVPDAAAVLPPQPPAEPEMATPPVQPLLDPAGAVAQREADRPPEPTGAPEPGDILNVRGEPFKNMRAAMGALKAAGKDDHEIVRVADGLVVRKTGATDGLPDVPAPAGVVDGADASGRDITDGSPGDTRLLAADPGRGGAPVAGNAAPGSRADVLLGDGNAADAALTADDANPAPGANPAEAIETPPAQAPAPVAGDAGPAGAAVVPAAGPTDVQADGVTRDAKPPTVRRAPRSDDPLFQKKNTLRQLQNTVDAGVDPQGGPLRQDRRAQYLASITDLQTEIAAASPRARRESRAIPPPAATTTPEGARDETQQAQEASQASAEEGAEPAVLTPPAPEKAAARRKRVAAEKAAAATNAAAPAQDGTRLGAGRGDAAPTTAATTNQTYVEEVAGNRAAEMRARAGAVLSNAASADWERARATKELRKADELEQVARIGGDAIRAKPTDATTMPEADIAALAGKTVAIEVQVGDTGKTATLTMDAAEAVRDVKKRLSAAEILARCLA